MNFFSDYNKWIIKLESSSKLDFLLNWIVTKTFQLAGSIQELFGAYLFL